MFFSLAPEKSLWSWATRSKTLNTELTHSPDIVWEKRTLREAWRQQRTINRLLPTVFFFCFNSKQPHLSVRLIYFFENAEEADYEAARQDDSHFFKSKKNFSQLEFGCEGDKLPKLSASSCEDNKQERRPAARLHSDSKPSLSSWICLCVLPNLDWLLLNSFVINEFPWSRSRRHCSCRVNNLSPESATPPFLDWSFQLYLYKLLESLIYNKTSYFINSSYVCVQKSKYAK